MRAYATVLMLGLGAGAVYAAIGLGLVLAHRASGVLNLAHGAVAMYGTYVFADLRERGELVLPVIGLPHRIDLGGPLPLPAAFATALAAAAALGLVLAWAVFRPLRAAPPLAGVVASVGVMVALQAVAVLHFGTANRAAPAVLPAAPVDLAGLSVPRDRLWLVAAVVAATAALALASRRTRVGLATRAVAEDEAAAALLGWSPDALAAANWALAAALAAAGGILTAPITGLTPATASLLVVPALAAALVGRLSSFAATTAAALALGMAQSALALAQTDVDWLPSLRLREALPLAVIVALAARGGAVLPERGRPVERRLPAAGRPRRPALAAAAGVAAGVPLLAAAGSWRLALVTSMIAALVCLSLVVLTGYVGQASLAQVALAGIAGFSLASLAGDAGVPFPLAPLAAAALAAAAGVAVGVPALRLRGAGLAVVTLAAAVALEELVFRSEQLAGGLRGRAVPAPTLAGLDLGPGGAEAAAYPRTAFAVLVLALLVAAAAGVARMRVGPLGRRFLAVRANERAAAAAGVDVARTKLAAFALAGALAGAGGALTGYLQGSATFESYGVFVSLGILAVAYVGGVARIAGALAGGALAAGGLVFTALERAAGLGRYQFLAGGLGLVVAAVAAPDGLAGAAARAWRRRRPRS